MSNLEITKADRGAGSVYELVETTHGKVQGLKNLESGVTSFKGIPYAQPPVGKLRWRDPESATPWNGTLEAFRFGAAAAQPLGLGGHIEELCDFPDKARAEGYLGSEDCLTLNVWSRGAQGKKRPVMIWIHGGANWLDSSRSSVYGGEALSGQLNVVVFSINYRLGIFGFLDVSVLGGDLYRGSSALGLLDQQMAIEWIYANAGAFGGDPENITLVGQSAGSMNISWHLTTGRLPKGVRRAVLMSGVAGVPGVAQSEGYSYYSDEEGKSVAKKILGGMGIRSMEELNQAPTGELIRQLISPQVSEHLFLGLDSVFYPRVDGVNLTMTPFEFAAKGLTNDYPLLIGVTEHEASFWMGQGDLTPDVSIAEVARAIPGAGVYAEKLASVYEGGTYDIGDGRMALLSDAMFVMPALLIAESHAEAGGKCWFYQYSRRLPGADLGAAHSSDLAFFLGTWQTEAAESFYGAPTSPEEAQIRSNMSTFMTERLGAFLYFGNPEFGMDSSEGWPPYSIEGKEVLTLSERPSLIADPFSSRRSVWTDLVYSGLK